MDIQEILVQNGQNQSTLQSYDHLEPSNDPTIMKSKYFEKLTQKSILFLSSHQTSMYSKSTQVTRIQDIELTPQGTKPSLIKRFGEDIGQLVIGSHMTQSDISFELVVSQEMMSNGYVLCSRVLYRVFGQFDGTLIVTQEWNFCEVATKVTQDFLHP